MTEWRPIPDFAAYEISDVGGIRRLLPGKGRLKGDLLNPSLEKRTGYHHVVLMRGGKLFSRRVHNLLCLAFHGEPPTPRHHAAHDDGIPANNTPANVFWKTPKQNAADMVRHGTAIRGERCGTAKLTGAQVQEIRNALGLHREIAARFGVNRQTIGKIKNGDRWNHLERTP